MTLLYKVKDNADKKSVRISFDPPLAGYEEVKPRLLAMTADAQESLGMVRYYSRSPPDLLLTWTANHPTPLSLRLPKSPRSNSPNTPSTQFRPSSSSLTPP